MLANNFPALYSADLLPKTCGLLVSWDEMIGKRGPGAGKSSLTRFNLLLLEDGEYFLEDFSVYSYPDPRELNITPEQSKERKIQGRLKLCTRSLIFEPQELQQPLVKYAFRSMSRQPMRNDLGGDASSLEDSSFFSFVVSDVVEMKKRGMDHPYVHTKNILPPRKIFFSFLHSTLEIFLTNISPLWKLAHEKQVLNKLDEENRLASFMESRLSTTFDTSLLVDFRERPLIQKGKLVNKIEPLLKYPGCFMLTNSRVYFQPAQVNNVGNPVENYTYSEIDGIYKRRHMLKQCGLEFYLQSNSASGGMEQVSVFFSFRSQQDRNEIYDVMCQQLQLDQQQEDEQKKKQVLTMMLKWQKREISTFDYLMFLNSKTGRTTNDLTQFPVFPWIIQDYDSPVLDLTNPNTFRDLSKPVGALSEERLSYFRTRFEAMPKVSEVDLINDDLGMGLPPPFLYGTHYSTPGYVLYYMVRQAPEYMLCLQNGKFDSPDRLFQSIKGTWESCLKNHADLKELIPVFYDTNASASDWLENRKNLDLGATQSHTRVDDVELPCWAANANDFVAQNREALECDYVSQHIHEWIDLIFGFKQKGDQAIQANNLFYYLSYEGAVDLETIQDPVQKCSFEAQIQEFGQTPSQLFTSAHPSRNQLGETPGIACVLSKNSHLISGGGEIGMMNMPDEVVEELQKLDLSPLNNNSGVHNRGVHSRNTMFTFQKPSLNALSNRVVKAKTSMISSLMRGRKSFNRKQSWKHFNGYNSDSLAFSCSKPYKFHQNEVTSCVLSSDERALFTTSKDSTLKITAVSDGSFRRSLNLELTLSCCDVTPDEKHVLLGSWDNHLYLYSVECGRILDKVMAHDDAISSLKIMEENQVITTSWDSSVKLWRYRESGFMTSPLCTFMESDSSLLSLGVYGNIVATGADNGLIHLYDLRMKNLIRKVFGGNGSGKNGGIVSVDFGSDGSTISCCSLDNSISLYSVGGKRISTFNAQTNGNMTCLVTDGTFAVGGSSDGIVYFYRLDAPSGKHHIASLLDTNDSTNKAISSIAINPVGTKVISGTTDGVVRVWTCKK